MNNLHIIQDGPHSNWFVERCIKFGANSINQFVCLSNSPKHITHSEIDVRVNTLEVIKSIAVDINNGSFQNVIISYLDETAAHIIEFISNKKVNIIWIIWGADLYYLPKFWRNNYDDYSSSFLNINFKNNLFKQYQLAKKHYLQGHRTYHHIYNAIKKVTICATLTTSDYQLVKIKLNSKVKLIDFVISGIDDFVGTTNIDLNQKKQNIIQIGNSADPSNNHFEIFKKMKDVNFNGQIYCPLSYGNLGYAKKLKADISSWFSEEQLLTDDVFIPKAEYFEKISKIGFVVMAHNRQQSFGNLIAQLYFGAKVFLKYNAPLYLLFSGWGLVVYTIEKDLNEKELASFLEEDFQSKNRLILSNLLSNKRIETLYNNLLNAKINEE